MAGLLPFVKTNALLESFYLSDLSSIPNLTDPLDNRNHIWPHPREPHEWRHLQDEKPLWKRLMSSAKCPGKDTKRDNPACQDRDPFSTSLTPPRWSPGRQPGLTKTNEPKQTPEQRKLGYQTYNPEKVKTGITNLSKQITNFWRPPVTQTPQPVKRLRQLIQRLLVGCLMDTDRRGHS